MNPAVLNWGPVAVIVLGYVFGIYFQNRSNAQLGKRIDDLRADMNSRLGHLDSDVNQRSIDLNQRLNDMNNRISDLKDFIHSENQRLEDRLERLERPVLRP